MAVSFPSEPDQRPRAPLLAALACAVAGTVAAQPVQAPTAGIRNLPINVDAASSDVDYRSNTLVFRDVVITQGTTRVSADLARATGLDFRDSTWTFTGNVRIERDGGVLESDAAQVQFRANLLRVATIQGKPARFEQQLARTAGTAHGRASTIVYDLDSDHVTFTGDAWLSDGRNEISGEQLVYNVRDQRVLAEPQPGTDSRVRITIRPKDGNGDQPRP